MITTIAYIIYLSLVLLIVIFVGGYLFKNGKFYLQDIFNDEHLVNSVNKFMYVGYCLVNAGGAFNCLNQANNFNSYTTALEYVSSNIGQLLVLLGIMHFINMIVLPIIKKLFIKKTKQQITNP